MWYKFLELWSRYVRPFIFFWQCCQKLGTETLRSSKLSFHVSMAAFKLRYKPLNVNIKSRFCWDTMYLNFIFAGCFGKTKYENSFCQNCRSTLTLETETSNYIPTTRFVITSSGKRGKLGVLLFYCSSKKEIFLTIRNRTVERVE